MKYLFALFMVLPVSAAIFPQEIKKMKMSEVMHFVDTSTSPLVVNFWASWCDPCVHELPWFEKQVYEYKAEGVRLLLVSLDFAEDYPRGIADFARKHGYRSPIVWLDESNPVVFCPVLDRSWSGEIPVSLMVNNKKHYRKFFNQQIPEPRLKLELKALVE